MEIFASPWDFDPHTLRPELKTKNIAPKANAVVLNQQKMPTLVSEIQYVIEFAKDIKCVGLIRIRGV